MVLLIILYWPAQFLLRSVFKEGSTTRTCSRIELRNRVGQTRLPQTRSRKSLKLRLAFFPVIFRRYRNSFVHFIKCRISPLKIISVTALYDFVDGRAPSRGLLIFKGEAVQGKIEAKLEMMI